ncbi:MAG TPA: UPF0158 family protein, partial [Candidatus Limnocylindria bacterium]
VDLAEFRDVLEDHSGETSWWFDFDIGVLYMFTDSMWDGEEVDREFELPDGVRCIDPIDLWESYGDLEDFTAMVRDPRTRDLLERAIAGRGAFRRFKDVLHEFPDLRATWFKFHDARMERRAIEWLRDEGLVDEEAAERALSARPDPELPGLGGPFDAPAVAQRVADDLRGLYGKRLREVILFGSWARGDAHPESDIDLLIVLDRVDEMWREYERMNEILYRHSLGNDTVVTALVVGARDYASAQRPVLIRARAEGRSVG